MHVRWNSLLAAAFLLCLAVSARSATPDVQDALEVVRRAEQARVEMVSRAAETVVCIYDPAQQGGGSGVIIDPRGYGLTNFHVVAKMLSTRRGVGGLSDGRLYDLEVLGVDPTGDVAMFRLTGKDEFAFSPLGNSELVDVGDTVFAMGNPFMVSEDYTPSVSMGLVTGTHRYQWGQGNNLVYTDCIQIDAPINPGNSGGPLFNDRGEVVGINGRISINTRGRFNVGFGYAISMAQIRRFMPAMRAGLLAKHGTLDAVAADIDRVGVVFSRMLPGRAAERAGIEPGDRLVSLDGIPIRSRNEYASIIGTYPEGWPLRVVTERLGEEERRTVRLDAVEPNLREGFSPDAELNDEAVERVLGIARASLLGSQEAELRSWEWTVERTTFSPEGEPSGSATYRASASADGPIEYAELEKGQPTGRTLQFDASTASESGASSDQRFDLVGDAHVVRMAIYRAVREIATTSVEDLADSYEHVGADALLGSELPAGGPPRFAAPRGAEVILDLLETNAPGGARLRLGIDASTGQVRQVQIEDTFTGRTGELLLDKFHDVSGVMLPGRMTAQFGDELFVETYSNWKVTP